LTARKEELVTSYYTAQMSGFMQSGNLFCNFKSEILYSDCAPCYVVAVRDADSAGASRERENFAG
jgi:hypothetical protein